MTLLSTLFIYLINQYIGLRNGMRSLLKNEIIRTYETYVKYLKSLYTPVYIDYKYMCHKNVPFCHKMP